MTQPTARVHIKMASGLDVTVIEIDGKRLPCSSIRIEQTHPNGAYPEPVAFLEVMAADIDAELDAVLECHIGKSGSTMITMLLVDPKLYDVVRKAVGGSEPDAKAVKSSFGNGGKIMIDVDVAQCTASAEEDSMFLGAVQVVLDAKTASVSLLQRKLFIGYVRASRLIDMMGNCNIIGEQKGSVAREVIITAAEWRHMNGISDDAY